MLVKRNIRRLKEEDGCQTSHDGQKVFLPLWSCSLWEMSFWKKDDCFCCFPPVLPFEPTCGAVSAGACTQTGWQWAWQQPGPGNVMHKGPLTAREFLFSEKFGATAVLLHKVDVGVAVSATGHGLVAVVVFGWMMLEGFSNTTKMRSL